MTDIQTQPVARQKQHSERVTRSAIRRPRRGGPLTAMLAGGVFFVCLAGLVAALLLTAYLALAWWRPGLIPPPMVMNEGVFENLVGGTIFFWLELVAIVGLLRIVDDFRLRARNKSQLFDIHEHLVETVTEIDDMRYQFAVKLDESRTEKGGYNTDLGFPNREVRNYRDRFLLTEFSDPDVTPYAQALVARVLKILDRMLEETYWAIEDAERFNHSEATEALEAAINKIFDATNPGIQGLGNLARLLEEARDTL